MLSCEVCKVFKSNYFEEDLQTTASTTSSFHWLQFHNNCVSALALTEMILHPEGRWTFLFVFWFILWLTFLRRGETGRGNKSWIIPLNSLNIRRKIWRRSLMKTTNGICPESFWSYELVLTIKKFFPEKRPTLRIVSKFRF